jgi:hypothetical protein
MIRTTGAAFLVFNHSNGTMSIVQVPQQSSLPSFFSGYVAAYMIARLIRGLCWNMSNTVQFRPSAKKIQKKSDNSKEKYFG